jgi:hypothetical protein
MGHPVLSFQQEIYGHYLWDTLFIYSARVQGKARQGKARQGKAMQGKARQGKARQGKARQGKARQGKARQGKARQGKARQCIVIFLYFFQFLGRN